MKKRILSGILCLALLFGTWSPVLAEETDLSGAEVLQTEDLPEIEAGIPEVENPVEKESEITEDVVAGEGETEETEIEDVNMDSALIDESESAEETEEDKKVEEEPVVEGMPDPLTGLDSRWYLGPIHAQEAWAALPASGNKVKVGIIDTGFRIGVGNLYDSVLNQGQSFLLVNGVKTPIADDVVNYHGTDVANIFTSVCGDTAAVNMVDLVLVDVAGDSSTARAEDVANAIRSLTDLGCKVLSISLGTVGSNSYLAGACEYAVSKGTIIVCADGTGEDSNEYLASLETTISVAAMTENGGILYSGNGGNANIAAPGNRTSYAAPVVAAAAAMMKYSGTSNGTLWNPEEKVETDSGKMLSSLNLQYAVGAGAVDISDQIEINEIEERKYIWKDIPYSPEITVSYGGNQLRKDVDYKVSYKDNVEVGDAKIIVEGITFNTIKTYIFKIHPFDCNGYSYGNVGFWDYTGQPIEPVPELILDTKGPGEKGCSIVSIEYENNIEIGRAKGEMRITGNQEGVIDFWFFIVNDTDNILSEVQIHNFEEKLPVDFDNYCRTEQKNLSISLYGYELYEYGDYQISYENNEHAGKDAKLIIEGKNFKGKKEIPFEITPIDVGELEYGHIGDFLYSGEKIEPALDNCCNYLKNIDSSNLPKRLKDSPLAQWAQYCTVTPKYDGNTVEPGEVSGTFELTGNITGRIHFTYSIIDPEALTDPLSFDLGDGFKWNLDPDGVLRITGEGELSYDADDYVVKLRNTYGKYIKKIVIEEGITILPNFFMFYGLNKVTQVKLPSTIQWLGYGFFGDCIALTEVENYELLLDYPESFTNAFYGTPFLEKYIRENPDYMNPIKDQNKDEGTWVGEKIEPLPGETSIQISFDDDDTIYRLFEKSGVLTIEAPVRDLNQPGMKSGIRMKAHDWSEYVDRINAIKILNDSCYEIPDNAFIGLTNLESFETVDGASIDKIGKNAFFGCRSLKNVRIFSWGTLYLDDYSFGNCYELENLDIEGFFSKESIDFEDNCGKFVFANCKKLQSINLSSVDIPEYAFYGCTELKKVGVGDKGDKGDIGAYAFAKCENLESVQFKSWPGGNAVIGAYAFADCKKLNKDSILNVYVINVYEENAFANTYGEPQVNLTYPMDKALDEYYKNYSNSYHEVNILLQKVEVVVNGTVSSVTETQPKTEEQSKPTSTTLQEQSKPGTTTQQGQNQPGSATPQGSSNSTTSIPQNPTAQSSQNAHGNAAATAEANAEEDTSLDSKEHDVPATQQSTSFLNQQEEQNQMGTPVIFLVIPMVLLAGIILTVLILYRKRFR